MTNQKFKFTEDPKFLRGLLFLATGTFLMLRFAAGNANRFFMVAAWFSAIIALVALVLFLWSVYENSE